MHARFLNKSLRSNHVLFWILTVSLWLAACCLAQTDCSIDFWTVGGGSGTSTRGPYLITATIGQPDSVTLSSGSYTLAGGFWGAVAAIPPARPQLHVTLTPTNTVVIWWTSSSANWRLLTTASLVDTGSSWTECPYQVSGAVCYRAELPSVGARFYCLDSP